jgi:hypothetical protein
MRRQCHLSRAKAANPVNRRNQFASLGFILGFRVGSL